MVMLHLNQIKIFAQEESKNLSDNLKWRARKKFEQWELIINTTRFLGYDKDEYGDLVINPKEAEVPTILTRNKHYCIILVKY
ncbi:MULTISPECIES: recombinase [Clostridium]|nr:MULTISPECIES: recombinase [Clostridium]MDI9208860.1 recombinase [Clostridium butyricum]MDU1401333.1 recombinase [Clostridium sp.]MDU1602972.1 recombinase [Clostridium sp.]MDU4928299.1 recombinase [Clostridium sp.]